ncbi:MAG: TPM domain-containing protein [Cyanobacteria bacterium]|nr:TPM domain-containing protein [Cyanobacteriota bacterium]
MKTQVLYHRKCAWAIGFEKPRTRIRAWMLIFFCGLFLLAAVFPNPGYTQQKPPSTQVASEETVKINTPPPTPSGPGRWVNDYDHLLTPEDVTSIQTMSMHLASQGRPQIIVVTLPDTDRDLSEFTSEIMNQWKNSQVLILINGHLLRDNAHRGSVFVGVKTGLQGTLPDAVLGRMIRENAVPLFQKGNYSEGIKALAISIAQIIETKTPANAPHQKTETADPNILFLIFIGLFLLMHFFNRKNRRSENGYDPSPMYWYGSGSDSSSSWGGSSDSSDYGTDSGGGDADGGGAGY